MTPLTSQLYSFGLTLLIGLCIGMFYDLYYRMHKWWKPNKPLSNISDYFFWLVITIFTFVFLLLGNFGEVRFYVIIGLITGALIYIKIFGKWITPLIVKFFKGIAYILTLIIQIVLFPFKLIRKVLLIPLGFISFLVAKITGLIQRILWKLFGRPVALLSTRFKRKYYRTKERALLRLIRALKRK